MRSIVDEVEVAMAATSLPTAIGQPVIDEPPIGYSVAFHILRGLRWVRDEQGWTSELGTTTWEYLWLIGTPLLAGMPVLAAVPAPRGELVAGGVR